MVLGRNREVEISPWESADNGHLPDDEPPGDAHFFQGSFGQSSKRDHLEGGKEACRDQGFERGLRGAYRGRAVPPHGGRGVPSWHDRAEMVA